MVAWVYFYGAKYVWWRTLASYTLFVYIMILAFAL